MNLYPRSGPYRGLLRHWRAADGIWRQTGTSWYHRELFPAFPGPTSERGFCRWCDEPCETRRHLWHPECVVYYFAALARLVAFDEHWMPPTDCPCGKPGAELDHRLALAVAWHLGERAWLRAHLPSNLQWLCRDCHRRKTAEDRAMIAGLKRGHTGVLVPAGGA